MKAKPIRAEIDKNNLDGILSLFWTGSNETAITKQPKKPEINTKTYEGRKMRLNECDFGAKRYMDCITFEYTGSPMRDWLKPNSLNTNIQLPCSVPAITP